MTCLVASLLVAGCTLSTTAADKTATPATPVPTLSAVMTAVPDTIVPATTVPAMVATTQATPVTTPSTVFNTYSNTPYGFSIDYPSDWQKNELNLMESSISPYRYDVVEFYSPSFLRCNTEKNDCVNVRAEVKVEVDTQPVSTELDTFFIKDVARITTGSGVEITKRDAMFKLVGDKAYRLDYHAKSSTENINALSAYTVKNGKGYIITFHAHAPEREEKNNQFEEYYNDAMAMFSSFTTNSGTYRTI
jgi:LysM repeat protein